MDYAQALGAAMADEELVANYDRLNGSSFGTLLKKWLKLGTDGLSDEDFEKLKPGIEAFDKFFFEFIWSRLPTQAFTPSPSVN